MKNEYNEGDLVGISLRGRMALAHYSQLPRIGVVTKSRKTMNHINAIEVTWINPTFGKSRMHIDFIEPLAKRTKNVLDF